MIWEKNGEQQVERDLTARWVEIKKSNWYNLFHFFSAFIWYFMVGDIFSNATTENVLLWNYIFTDRSFQKKKFKNLIDTICREFNLE